MKQDEYGWIIIDTEEKKKKFGPIREGDEYFFRALKWEMLTGCFGKPFWPEHDYRRPLVLPDDPEWELVPLDGVTENGENAHEIFDSEYNEWRKWTGARNQTIESVLGWANHLLAFRRRKQPAQANGWVMTSERVPQDNRNYFAQVKRTGEVLVREAYLIRDNPELFTQWLDYANPEPVKSEDEKAFEEFWSREVTRIEKVECSKEDAQIIWKASQDHAKGGK